MCKCVSECEWAGCGATAWNSDGREPRTVPTAQRRNGSPGRDGRETVGISSTAALCSGGGGEVGSRKPKQQLLSSGRKSFIMFLQRGPRGGRGSQPGLHGSVSRGRSPRPWLGGCASCSSCLCRSARPHFLKLVYSSWLIYHCFPKN